MIVFFKVRNYKSIKDTLTLSFVSTSIGEHTDSNLIEKGRDSLLKSMLIYGANASGKSKILDAIVFFKWFILSSATELKSNLDIPVEKFALNEDSMNKPSFFEISFYIGKTKFRYGFEATEDRIEKEWLLESKRVKEYVIFLRIKDKIQVEENRFPNSEGLESRTRKNALFLSVCANWNVKKAEAIYDWFYNIETVHGMMDSHYRNDTIDLIESKKYSKLIKAFIRKADFGINSVDTYDVKLEDFINDIPDELVDDIQKQFENGHKKTIVTRHKIYNDNKEVVGVESFLLDKHESEGTKKFFNLLGVYIKSILEDKFLIIDEFDARLHTLLTKSILKLFNSEKIKTEAQLLVVCHDSALIDKKLLRRDQVCFIEKNREGGTELTSLVEYKPRKESPFDKNYLNGKYGGIPFIEDLEDLF